MTQCLLPPPALFQRSSVAAAQANRRSASISSSRTRGENAMRLKAFLGLLGLTLATAVLLLTLLVGGAAGGHGKSKGHTNSNGSGSHGRIGYHFLVVDQIQGQPDRLILQGNGSFNRNRASGGGTFDHFLACVAPPACTVVATGTWKAEDVVS